MSYVKKLKILSYKLDAAHLSLLIAKTTNIESNCLRSAPKYHHQLALDNSYNTRSHKT
jgi:hypothetical protein